MICRWSIVSGLLLCMLSTCTSSKNLEAKHPDKHAGKSPLQDELATEPKPETERWVEVSFIEIKDIDMQSGAQIAVFDPTQTDNMRGTLELDSTAVDNFLQCYIPASAPQVEGQINFRVHLAKDGAVSDVETQSFGALPAKVVTCCSRVANAMHFPKPTTATGRVVFGIAFSHNPGVVEEWQEFIKGQ